MTATQLTVERPAAGERRPVRDQVVVDGWAFAPEGAPAIAVTIGGRPAEVEPGGWRPDVSAALGVGAVRGYTARIPVAVLEPGPVEVQVTAVGADGVPVHEFRVVEVDHGIQRRAGRPRPWAGDVERLDPRLAPGGLTHVEHLARYRWVAPLASGRDVLDAACGIGYGAHVLQDAGASTVTGVDAFAGAVVSAREAGRPGLEYLVGDLLELPFPDDAFDLVVCFEAIEHIAEQDRLLAELRRVLRPDGVLAVSTPIPGAVDVHNPHHVAELWPDELERRLHRHFAHVALRWQHSALASVVDLGPGDGRLPAPSPPMGWTAGPIEPVYTLALASDAELPAPAPTGVLGAGHDVAAMVTQVYALADDAGRMRALEAAQRARAERAEQAYLALQSAAADELAEARAAIAAYREDAERQTAAAWEHHARGEVARAERDAAETAAAQAAALAASAAEEARQAEDRAAAAEAAAAAAEAAAAAAVAPSPAPPGRARRARRIARRLVRAAGRRWPA